MSRPITAVAALSKKSVNQKIQLGEAIGAALTEHADVFKDPNPTAAELAAATDELHEANKEAATGSHTGKQRLKKAVLAFDRCVGIYQDYVNMTAQGDGVIIEMSGLQVSRSGQRVNPTPVAGTLKLTGTSVGQITGLLSKVPGAKAYVWMSYAGPTPPTTDDGWQFLCGTSRTRNVLNNRPSGTREWLRAAAVTTAGQGPWSEPVSRIVL